MYGENDSSGSQQSHENEPRLYECFCPKVYTTYSGIYLHLKFKHSQIFGKYKKLKITRLFKKVKRRDGKECYRLEKLRDQADEKIEKGSTCQKNFKGLTDRQQSHPDKPDLPPNPKIMYSRNKTAQDDPAGLPHPQHFSRPDKPDLNSRMVYGRARQKIQESPNLYHPSNIDQGEHSEAMQMYPRPSQNISQMQGASNAPNSFPMAMHSSEYLPSNPNRPYPSQQYPYPNPSHPYPQNSQQYPEYPYQPQQPYPYYGGYYNSYPGYGYNGFYGKQMGWNYGYGYPQFPSVKNYLQDFINRQEFESASQLVIQDLMYFIDRHYLKHYISAPSLTPPRRRTLSFCMEIPWRADITQLVYAFMEQEGPEEEDAQKLKVMGDLIDWLKERNIIRPQEEEEDPSHSKDSQKLQKQYNNIQELKSVQNQQEKSNEKKKEIQKDSIIQNENGVQKENAVQMENTNKLLDKPVENNSKEEECQINEESKHEEENQESQGPVQLQLQINLNSDVNANQQ